MIRSITAIDRLAKPQSPIEKQKQKNKTKPNYLKKTQTFSQQESLNNIKMSRYKIQHTNATQHHLLTSSMASKSTSEDPTLWWCTHPTLEKIHY